MFIWNHHQVLFWVPPSPLSPPPPRCWSISWVSVHTAACPEYGRCRTPGGRCTTAGNRWWRCWEAGPATTAAGTCCPSSTPPSTSGGWLYSWRTWWAARGSPRHLWSPEFDGAWRRAVKHETTIVQHMAWGWGGGKKIIISVQRCTFFTYYMYIMYGTMNFADLHPTHPRTSSFQKKKKRRLQAAFFL